MAILGTQSLTQLVKVRPEASGTVDARQAFLDPEQGALLQSRFFPLSPQIDALRAAAETGREGGSILIAGAAGTGKSMLLFMLAKALSVAFPGDEFTAVCDRIHEAQAVRALGGLRNAGRRWLVVMPETSSTDDFDSAVRRALNGALYTQGVADFAPTPGNLRDEFAQTVEHLKAKGGFDGIAILFDGFDEFVADALEDANSPVAGQVAGFGEWCRSSRFPVFLAALVDREMGLFSLDEETRLLKMFSRVQPVTLLGKSGEWEELVGKVILEHPDDETWAAVRAHQDLRVVRENLGRIGLYQGTSDRWQTEMVVDGAYPLHPAALFALPRVALRLASKGKTAFTFFSDASPGGLLYFLKNFAVAQPNGRLSLYTADSLFTHFERAIEEDAANQDYLEALQKAVLAAGDIPQARRLLRMVLIFQMVGHDRLRSRADDLIWALHLGEREVRIARRSLDLLVQKNALRYSEGTEEYLLPLERKQVSLEESLARTRNRVRTELDITAVLQRQIALPRLPARKFNQKHGADRTAFGRLFRASELRDSAGFQAVVEEAVGQVRPYRGDVLVAYVLAETPEELQAVRSEAEAGRLDHPRVILALPREAQSFSREALEAMALERMRALEPPFSDPTSAEHKRVSELLESARDSLRRSFQKFMDTRTLEFRHQGTITTDLDEEALVDYVDDRVAALVGKPPAVAEPALAFLRDPGRARRQRQQALNYLLACRGELALRTDAGATGRILRAGLAESGIIAVTGHVGSWTHYDLAAHVPDKGLGKAFRLVRERLVGGAGEDRTVEATEVVRPLMEAPHSLTPAMVELLLAAVLWKWPRELCLCRNWQRAQAESRPDLLETVPATAETLFELVGSPGDWAIRYADAEPSQRDFLDGILRLVGKGRSARAASLWNAAGEALLEWYESLPAAARTPGAAAEPDAQAVRNLLADEKARQDLREMVQVRLPRALGAPPIFSWQAEGEDLLERLAQARQALEGVVTSRLETLRAGLREIFGAHAGGDQSLAWPERARRWLASVADDLHGPGVPPEHLVLAEVAEAYDGAEAAGELATALGYPPIAEWRHDLSGEILERFRAMREEIEWGPYRQAYADAADPEASVLDLVRPVLTRAGLPQDELEALLVAELELAVWPESIHEEAPPVTEEPPAAPVEELPQEPAVAEMAPEAPPQVPVGVAAGVPMEVTEAWATSAPEAAAGAEPVAAAAAPEAEPVRSRATLPDEDEPTLQWL